VRRRQEDDSRSRVEDGRVTGIQFCLDQRLPKFRVSEHPGLPYLILKAYHFNDNPSHGVADPDDAVVL